MIVMENGKSPADAVKKTNLAPKSIIFQKFGSKACYKVEEVQESSEKGCPGLAIPQKGPCSYRCILQLPEITIESGIFKRKKDAEKSAAEMAIEKVLFISLSINYHCYFSYSLSGQYFIYCLTCDTYFCGNNTW